MDIVNFLPMLPWEGPPLPRFLNIRWPSLQGGQQGLALPSLPFLGGLESSYDNEEIWEWQDYKGRQRRITVTRHAKVR